MDIHTKRERLKAVVLEQEQVRTEIERLTLRSTDLDVQLDQLLAAPAPTSRKAKSGTVPKAPAPPAEPTGRKAKKGGGRREMGKTKRLQPAKASGKAKSAKATATVKPKTPAKAGPTLKEKILAALRDRPEGLELGVVAKQAYGSEDTDTRRKCEQNLYNMAKQKLVRHDGPKWQVVAAAA